KNYGDGWIAPLNISNVSGRDMFPRIALWKERIFVVWDHRSPDEVYLAQFNGSQWLTPVNISMTLYASSRNPAVSIGKYGIAMAAWKESVESYPYFNKYPWSDTSRVWSEWGIYPDVVSDTFDVPHVIASGPPSGNAELRYATLTDTGWIYEVLPIGELWEPIYPVIIIDSSNVVHIVFKAKHLSDPDIDIYYMKSKGGGGIPEDVLQNDTIISYNGKIYIHSSDNGTYEVYDLTGKVIKRGRLISGENYIMLKDIPAGTYFLRAGKEGLKKILLIK
ncbi:T9SS type A sorting domain-containing protein, partial [candidate division WOR-3 bacterium]|nr:T9SS type A sorting domain-containing protein [candidate division WOR-3 bacterium]